MTTDKLPRDIVDVAVAIAFFLHSRSCEYAFGGAIALGYWAAPRGTVDADVTLFLPPDQPEVCVDLLRDLGCDLRATDATVSLLEHGFCRVQFQGFQLDVFVPRIPFYEDARARRKKVPLDGHAVMIWDAETLCVFKMMFFRLKDLADVEAMLRTQGTHLDRDWVREQIVAIHGKRDPRVARWNELADAVSRE